jgi:hypothetical protein
MDAATDMTDFQRDVEEREVQMTFNDRLMEDMMYDEYDAACTQQSKQSISNPRQKYMRKMVFRHKKLSSNR